jgi:hypothetical protein
MIGSQHWYEKFIQVNWSIFLSLYRNRQPQPNSQEELDVPNFAPLTIGVGKRPGDSEDKDVSVGKSSLLGNDQKSRNQQQTLAVTSNNFARAEDPAVTTFRPPTTLFATNSGGNTAAQTFQTTRQQRNQQFFTPAQQQQRFGFTGASNTETTVAELTTTRATPTFATQRQPVFTGAFKAPINGQVLRFNDPITTTRRPHVTTTAAPATFKTFGPFNGFDILEHLCVHSYSMFQN